ncbi:MAG: DnaB-like helicase C-terminal domain-containing protein [Acidobacteriota bacterium]|nr:DnaB-like helicase C-terminal domain-containing protein [Acidobacteriota bacterium]
MERTETQKEAERAALGAALLEPAQIIPYAISDGKITAAMFYEHRNQVIFAAMLELFAAGRPVDILTLSENLERAGKLKTAGGLDYLNALVDAVPAAAHGPYYLGLVRSEWMRRRLIELAGKVNVQVGTGEEPEKIALESAESFTGILGELAEKEKSPEEVMQTLYAGWRAVKAGEKPSGLETPFSKLNQLLGGGLRPGLYLVAGRPSQGKSVLEENIAAHVAKAGGWVGRVAIDMPVQMVWARMLCREAGISLPKLNSGFAGESQLAKLHDEIIPMVKGYPIAVKGDIFDVGAITSWARGMKAKHNMQLMTLDFIQNVQISHPAAAYWQECQKITHVSGVLKRLALELEIPILCVSQLTRDNERDDRPPRLADLRGSGSLEQDATVVIFVYRDEKAVKKMGYEEQKKKRPVNVDIQKQQNGETGVIQCWLHAHYFMFEECGEEGFGLDE